MKTSTLLKSLSAVGILGTAVLSVNAHADCASGITQSGAGWQSCVPTGGGSSNSGKYYPADPSVLRDPYVVAVINRNNDKVYNVLTDSAGSTNASSYLEQICRNEGGNCKTLYITNPTAKCMTIFKEPVETQVRGRGLFAKSKTVIVSDYSYQEWNSPTEKAKKYEYIKSHYNGTAIKDICLN